MPSSSLFTAYINTFDRLSPFYALDPCGGVPVWERMADLVDQRNNRLPRREVTTALREQGHRFGVDDRSLAHIDALAADETLAVVTGQQVGLFIGPLYTVYKAITAINLAERLEHQLGRRVVPVFWMGADDHDFEEINHITVCNQANELVRLELVPNEPADRRSAAHIRFGDGINTVIDAFAGGLPDAEFKPAMIQLLRDCCPPDETFAAGFARLMARLFRGRGLVIVDPTDPALKRLMRPVFEREVRFPLRTTAAVRDAGQRLERAGYHQQIEREPDAVNLFLYHDGRRTPVAYADGRFSLRETGVSYSPEDLLRLIETTPDSFSQNVITRPIVQDSLLPTLAYIGGPSEIAYFAQLKGVYDHHGLPVPIVYPRASLTIVERRVAKVLEKYGLTVADFFGNIHATERRLIRDEMPDDLTTAFEQTRTVLTEHFGRLADEVASIDPTLRQATQSAQGKAEFELARLEEKAVQAYKRSNQTTRQQLEKAKQQLYPHDRHQERVFNIWPYLVLHGFGFIDTMFDAVDVERFAHTVVFL
ncbi:MAG: bacillithiol biosynthesis cysteine-adding enzyme BshC [Candidatus Latescibacteria bacterium]|nr:bacillithiol biosynthesis cysteine-adding enzyme BshC [Candidatus Latescibacterota bacterium]